MIFSLDHLYCRLAINALKNQTNDVSPDLMSEKDLGFWERERERGFRCFSRNLGFHAGVFEKRWSAKLHLWRKEGPDSNSSACTKSLIPPSFKGMLAEKDKCETAVLQILPDIREHWLEDLKCQVETTSASCHSRHL
jgi:hypothetical protein